MKIAVIETGGKQYLVSEGQKIMVEKIVDKAGLPMQAGGKFDFDKILLIVNDDKIEIGKPYLANKKINAEIVEQKRLPKVITYKYHSKNRYRNKKGHRQPVTFARIVSI